MARTFSAEDEERLRQLHADGLPRNRIAAEMAWSVGTITNHARRLGLSFDRTATAVATHTRQHRRFECRLQPLREDVLLGKRRATAEDAGTGHSGTVQAVKEHVAPALTEQVRVVCATCNNGWMNNLEEGVRSFLPALIRGGAARLDNDDQHALAAWSLKTMLMYQHTHRPKDQTAIPAEDYATFFEERKPSKLMTAQIAFMNYPPDDSVPLVDTLYQGYGGSDSPGRGWIGTLKIGCMVMQILRLGPADDGMRVTPFPNRATTRSVWPPTRPVGWPLRFATPYEDMKALAHPATLDWSTTPL